MLCKTRGLTNDHIHNQKGLMSSISCRILLVEDNVPYRTYLREILEEFGYNQILEASDGGEAFAALKCTKVGLVISDFSMSPASGIDLLRATRGEPGLQSLPFILITAVGDESTLAQAEKHDVSIFLRKPLHVDHLRNAISEALEGPTRKTLAEKYGHLRTG